MVQLVDFPPGVYKALGLILSNTQWGVVAQAYNYSTWVLRAGRSGVQGHPLGIFRANLRYPPVSVSVSLSEKFVCVCVFRYTCVLVCVHTTCDGGYGDHLRHCFVCLFCSVLRQDLSLALCLPIRPGWLATEPQISANQF